MTKTQERAKQEAQSDMREGWVPAYNTEAQAKSLAAAAAAQAGEDSEWEAAYAAELMSEYPF